MSVGRSSYTSRVLGMLASLYVELVEAVFSKFTEFVQLTWRIQLLLGNSDKRMVADCRL